MPKVAVDIWSDVMCPWCAVGYTQFARRSRTLKDELDVEVRWMPFELNPDLPPEGKEQAQHLAEVYGRSPERVAGDARADAGDRGARPASRWTTPARAMSRRR
jgi:predicted DsbA family dithiol-disulfide isomerase